MFVVMFMLAGWLLMLCYIQAFVSWGYVLLIHQNKSCPLLNYSSNIILGKHQYSETVYLK